MKYIATKTIYDSGEFSIQLMPENHQVHDEENAAAIQVLYEYEAATWEEAQAIHFLRMGWAPYKPTGKAEECPKCKALYYPLNSGQCWNCPFGHSNGTKAV